MMPIRLRQSFPGQNPQEIRCPECGLTARTSEDGIIWICENDPSGIHCGYYEQPADVVIPEESWKPQQ
jgi:ribosomal protein L37AE/L43A